MKKLALKDTPLTLGIENNQVVIRIGISTLAFSAHERENNEYCEEDNRPKWRIVDERQFAKDVLYAMQIEKEDGSTPLTDFLDDMIEDALDEGSIAVEYDEFAWSLEGKVVDG